MPEKFDYERWLKYYDETHRASRSGNMSRVDELKQMVNDYLKLCGMYMPAAKYPYDPEDKSTWKFLESRSLKKSEWTMINPDWKYKEKALLNGDF